MTSKIFVFFIPFFICFLTSSQQVNLKNGNFYKSFSDLSFENNFLLTIERTYNSKSTANGWFGKGWGNYFETYITPQIDGTILINEHGGGGKTWFEPLSGKKNTDIDRWLNKIVESEYPNVSKKWYPKKNDFFEKIKNNKETRSRYWKRLIKKESTLTSILKDSIFISHSGSFEKITVIDTGYIREKNSKKEFFNKNGKLIEVRFSHGFIKINYENDRAISIFDYLGNKIFIFYNEDDKIERLLTNSDNSCVYHYSDNEELIFSRNSILKKFGYEYDKKYNMTRIYNYVEKDTINNITITYYKNPYFTESIKDQYGDFTKYKYGYTPNTDKKGYWTEVIKPPLNKRITKDSSITRYTYLNGKIIEKKSDFEIIRKSYDGNSNRVSSLEKIDLLFDTKEKKSFIYSDYGRLIKFTSSDGTNFNINYENGLVTEINGLVKKIDNQKKLDIKFKYDSDRIIKIIDSINSNTLFFKYDQNNELTSVESNNQNHKQKLDLLDEIYNVINYLDPVKLELGSFN